MKTIAATEVQARFEELIDAVIRSGERIRITIDDKPVAFLFPYTPDSDSPLRDSITVYEAFAGG